MTLIHKTNERLRLNYRNSVSTIKNAFNHLIFYPHAVCYLLEVLSNLENSISSYLLYYFDFNSFWLSPQYQNILTGYKEGKYTGTLFIDYTKEIFSCIKPDNDFTKISNFYKQFISELKT
jgi:hypothetical protein